MRESINVKYKPKLNGQNDRFNEKTHGQHRAPKQLPCNDVLDEAIDVV